MENRTNLFGTDGVRGIVGDFLTPSLAYKVGKALAILAVNKERASGRPQIVIAGDTRTSTDLIKQSFISGALGCGADIIDMSILPTPAVSVITKSKGFDFGVMVTASHNPPEYNGIKVFDETGNKLSDECIKQVEYILKNDSDFGLQTFDKLGRYIRNEQLEEVYIEKVINNIEVDLSTFTVALDCANGACYSVAEKIFSRLKIKVYPFNNTCDGVKINVHCGALHPEFLQNVIKLKDFDFGFAFDGDGDRVVCVLKSGEVLDGDKILFVLAKLMQELGILYGNKIVATILTNYGLEHSLGKYGIQLQRVQVGDKNVSRYLQTEKLPLGGEKAGHIIISPFAKTGDAIYSALYMLKLLKVLNKNIEDVLQDLTLYPFVEKNVIVKPSLKKTILLNSNVLDAIERAQELIAERGRVVVRPSGTENKIRILVEGQDDKMNLDIANFLYKTIKQNG